MVSVSTTAEPEFSRRRHSVRQALGEVVIGGLEGDELYLKAGRKVVHIGV
ncbi:hypothetical protein [Streptomyces sp. T028]